MLREVQDVRLGAAILSLDVANGSDVVAAALSSGKVRVWRLDTGEVVHEFSFGGLPPFPLNPNEPNELIRTRFTPDGKNLAISYRGRIHIYEVSTWRELKSLGVEGEETSAAQRQTVPRWEGSGQMTVTDFAFTPDGGRILAAYCRAGCEDTSLSSNPGLLASPSGNDPVRLWDMRTATLVWEQKSVPTELAEVIAPSPNGQFFGTVSQELALPHYGHRMIRLYSLTSGQQLYALLVGVPSSEAAALRFVGDGSHFVSHSQTPWKEGEKSHRAFCMRNHLAIYDTETGKATSQIVNSYGAGEPFDFSSDGRWLAARTCTINGFQLWDMSTLEAMARVKPKGFRRYGVDLLRFAPGGRYLVVANPRAGIVAVFKAEF